MTDVVLGIDLGTSGVKTLLVDADGTVHGGASATYPTSHPRPGWLEQDPEDWWHALARAVHTSLELAPEARVTGIGLSGHMSGLVLTRANATAVRQCLLLADPRGAAEMELLADDLRASLQARSGNVPGEVFTIAKLLWVRQNEPDNWADTVHVLFPKDFLRMRLTGEANTEPTDAGNSLLLTEDRKDWDTVLIERAGLPPDTFPPMLMPSSIAGELTTSAAEALGLPSGTPVVAGASDMACAALGCGAVTEDIVAVTIGTASPVLRPVAGIRDEAIGTVTFHPHAVPGAVYALGSVLSGGLALSWSSKVLAPERPLEQLLSDAASSPVGSRGTLFIPTLVGAGTPWWESRARGAWVGLNPQLDRGDLVRAVLEGVAFNIRDSVDLMDRYWGKAVEVRFGGGGSRSALWAQILADVLGRRVRPLHIPEASALGAAILAAAGIGWFDTTVRASRAMVRVSEAVTGDPERHETYERLYPIYRAAYEALRVVDNTLATVSA